MKYLQGHLPYWIYAVIEIILGYLRTMMKYFKLSVKNVPSKIYFLQEILFFSRKFFFQKLLKENLSNLGR